MLSQCEPAWWKEATVYQIYPASFADHGDSGHGTLKGVLSKIPYLKSLGVDIIWLSPVYTSPQADMGYDIADYQNIDQRYGDLADWDAIRDACHAADMKIVMDLVVNHTSDQHAWFKESRSSRENPKRQWYHWHPGKVDSEGNRQPPNNWKSAFGAGSAWEWDDLTQEYYLHLYLKEQPDLNWECPELRQAVYTMMKWWLDRGTDGFRMDVINYISKAPGYPDAIVTAPELPYQRPGDMTVNRPRVHDFLREMHHKVLRHYDCFCVGECPGSNSPEEFVTFSKPENTELQMVFHFHHQAFDRYGGGLGRKWNPDWTLREMKRIFNTWNTEIPRLGGWNSNYLENHDQSRIISRLASDSPTDRVTSAKLCCMFHATLTGTIFIYQGQELGMINIPDSWEFEEYKDIEAIQNMERERTVFASRGLEGQKDLAVSLHSLRMTARDNSRTPMQWDDSKYAGFSEAEPWMRLHDDHTFCNVAVQSPDPNSSLSFWKRMLKLRKAHPSFIYGAFIPLDPDSNDTYIYLRHHVPTGERVLVMLNFAKDRAGNGQMSIVDLLSLGLTLEGASLLISNRPVSGATPVPGKIELGPWEGRVYLLK